MYLPSMVLLRPTTGKFLTERFLTGSALNSRGVQLKEKREKVPKPRDKQPQHARLYQDLPEFADRVSLQGHHTRQGIIRKFTHEKARKIFAQNDTRSRNVQKIFYISVN